MENKHTQNIGLMANSTALNRLILAIALFFTANTFGQEGRTYAWYAEHFPKAHAVKLIDETNIVVSVDDEGLKISRNLRDEKLLLSNTANGFKDGEITYSSFFAVRDIEANAYLPKENGSFTRKKIKDFRTEKVMSDHAFHDDNMAVRFQYPDLREGSKIELRYTEDILNPFFLPPAYLQDVYFAEKIKVTLEVPTNVRVKIDLHHVDLANVRYTREERKGVIFHAWELDSVAQFESEGGAPDPKYFVPHVTFIVEGYATNQGQEVPVLRSVADLYAWYATLLDSVDHALSPTIIETIDSIKTVHTDELQRAKALFNWVRASIKYIAVEDGLGGFIPDNPANVTHKRFGDCKGMSCLLATMMRHAGMDARECWIGTRDIPYSYAEIYTPFVDNHMITAYRYDNRWYFLDPTDEYVPFGFPSAFIQGKEALIGLPNKTFTLEHVPKMAAEANVVAVFDTLTLLDHTISGKAIMTNTGYSAARFKRLYRNAQKKDRFFKYFLESGNDKFSVDGEPVVNMRDTIIEVKYAYSLPDYSKNFDGRYFINLNTDRILSDDTFEDRKLPIERDHQQTYRFTHTLMVPEGYEVLALPENFSLQNAFANASITYTQKKGAVVYAFKLQLTELMIAPENMNDWNAMVKALRKAYRNNVELKKITQWNKPYS